MYEYEELIEKHAHIAFQRGRTAQMQWIVDELKPFILNSELPTDVRSFLSGLLTRGLIEINNSEAVNGTRSVAAV